MAEATTSTSASTNPSKPTQYIKASTNDQALEPDALRGSDYVLKDVPHLQDDEADRRKLITPEEKK